MAAKKTRAKTRSREPKGLAKGTPIPMPHGGTLIAGAGRGPAKGAPNAGRPPNEWKERLRAMASRDEVLEHVNEQLRLGPRRPLVDDEGYPVNREGERIGDHDTPFYVGSEHWKDALDYVTEHGYGKATQQVDVTSNGNTLEALLAASRLP